MLGIPACEKCHRDGTRTPLQQRMIALGIAAGVEPVMFEASDHPYSCTCERCRTWWRGMGPDPDTGEYGPFGSSLD